MYTDIQIWVDQSTVSINIVTDQNLTQICTAHDLWHQIWFVHQTRCINLCVSVGVKSALQAATVHITSITRFFPVVIYKWGYVDKNNIINNGVVTIHKQLYYTLWHCWHVTRTAAQFHTRIFCQIKSPFFFLCIFLCVICYGVPTAVSKIDIFYIAWIHIILDQASSMISHRDHASLLMIQCYKVHVYTFRWRHSELHNLICWLSIQW